MKGKFTVLFLSLACAFGLAFGISGCNGGDSAKGESPSGGEHVHNYGELIPRQDATCTDGGLEAHYFCSDCNKYFDVEKNETTFEELKIASKGHYGGFVPEKPATCTEDGLKAHFYCQDCGKYFNDKKIETEYANLNIPAKGHNYSKLFPQVDAQCEVAGTKAHYYCLSCGICFDYNHTQRKFEDLAIAPQGHNYGELVPQVDAQCEVAGTKAHYHCEDCGKYFDDKKTETEYANLNIPAKGHSYGELIPQVDAECEVAGMKAHYHCEDCGKYFDDKKTKTEYANLNIPAKGHNCGELIPQVDAQCEVAGTKAHYHCEDCGKYFDDKKTETEYVNLNIPVKGHSYGELIPQVDAQCEVVGMKAHYHCEDCGKYFDDNHTEKKFEDLTIAVKGHKYGELIPEKPATCTDEGMQAYYLCGDCNKYFDSEQNETTPENLKIKINSQAHNYGELIPEQPATCTEEGLEAHYHCEDCGKYFNGGKSETAYEDLKIDIDPKAHKWGADGKCEYCQKQKPPYTESGNYIYMGEYPQSEVLESGLKVTLGWEASNGELPTADDAHGWTDYGYYSEGEVKSYMWYTDVEFESERYRGVYFTSYRPNLTTDSSSTDNSYQDDNGYEINIVYWFKYEPIEWRILEQKDGTALLMSNIILDGQQFYRTGEAHREEDKYYYACDYRLSDIREWLNGTFYNTAFGEEEKDLIQMTEVDNSASTTASSSNRFACKNTNDNIFLLSYKDVLTSAYGFVDDSKIYDNGRQLKSTAYAKSQGVSANEDSGYEGNGWWWLRSPGDDKDGFVHTVSGFGYCQEEYSKRDITFTSTGVVPALRIKL